MASKRKPGVDPAARVTETLRRHGFPSPGGPGLAFTSEGDSLFARGYPHMRFLDDTEVTADKAYAKAEEALDAIDPTLRITVPRAVARMYLLGHRVGTNLFLDVPHQPQNARLRAEREARMRSGEAITIELLEGALSDRGVAMLDTYARWRWPKALYLYEAFLGTVPVARALVRHLVREADDLTRWGFAGNDPHRSNATPHYLARAFTWLALRLDPAEREVLRAELLRARAPSDTPGEPRAYLALLRAIATQRDDDVPAFALELALARGDADALGPLIAREQHAPLWHAGRIAWTLGTARLAGPLPISGHDLPRLVDQVAPLRDPGVVRLVAAIASQRAGRAAAAPWLRTHASYARPILRDLAALDDPKEKKLAEAGLALVNAETPVSVRVPTADELEAEIAAIFGALRRQLLRAAGDVAAQSEHIRDAYARYTEARAAAGDPIPEAYFTHRFGDFDCGEWAMLAVDAID